ncbi:PepSY domain-containing protein [Reinekea marinisedimentorum]|uniref:PepSY domain-containing protein n=1 Tax=Reinekea marinisedimentorum TaxID=230495 RepID=A0A4R3I359_9GAMM|nr:PepSY domain-containing protein [Reinekea marinisedimentorum]TCS40012.1 hypothetical protein BCF53_111107 [Reinekea marinisedimentorum]
MTRMISGLLFALMVQAMTPLFGADQVHPCTGEALPLTSEKSVVRAVECLYDGQVAKVERVTQGKSWYYRLRVLIPGGRIKTVDIDPESGMPLK